MWLRLSIVLGVLMLTAAAAGTWVFLNQDKVYGTQTAEATAPAEPDYPTAERDLGRLSRHFKAAPEPKKKSAWSFW